MLVGMTKGVWQMWTKIDGTIKLEHEELQIDSWSRDGAERSAPGLDGVITVDNGMRSRRIIQQCIIRAASESSLQEVLDTVIGLIDGKEHVVTLENGVCYEHLRVDGVNSEKTRPNGAGVSCSVKIIYTQLRSNTNGV
jgi:hypothetical protein